jgi:hypothetical protein
MMSIETVLPLVQALPHSAKFQLMQVLLAQLAQEEGLSLQMPSRLTMNRGQQMATILQRMADRHALSAIADPAEWQKNIRQDRPLPGRK